MDELKVAVEASSKFLPSILDHSVRSVKFKDLVAKFDTNSNWKPRVNTSARKDVDELQNLNMILKNKIMKLKGKFEGNLEKKSGSSLYELTNTNLRRVESLQRDLQDAKMIFKCKK